MEKRAHRFRVKSIWRTLQGEGFHAGRPAVFVRFAGCNLWSGEERDRKRDAGRNRCSCPLWCDTDFRKTGSETYSLRELVDSITMTAKSIKFCVLTGGEPLLQANASLMVALHEAGFTVAVETNGTRKLSDSFTHPVSGELTPPDWIVCSPKQSEEALQLEYFDELKLVVPDYLPRTYSLFAERARTHRIGCESFRFLWLQPEDGPRLEEAQKKAIELAKNDPRWRVSVQTHKVLGVD